MEHTDHKRQSASKWSQKVNPYCVNGSVQQMKQHKRNPQQAINKNTPGNTGGAHPLGGLVHNGVLGFLVEQVNPVRIDGNIDLVLGTSSGTRRYTSSQRITLAGQVQIGLCAHQLSDIHSTLDDACSCIGQIHFLIMYVLRTNAQDDFLVHIVRQVLIDLSLRNYDLILHATGGLCVVGAELNHILAVTLVQHCFDEVHLGRTQEASNELVDRLIIQYLRCIDLLNKTILHNNDPVAHGHCLGLVVGHINKCGVDPLAQLEPVCTCEDILQLQELCRRIYVSDSVKKYLVQIIQATREHDGLAMGVNPRGTLSYLHCVQAYAMIQGREYVTPDDVKELCVPVLGHRIISYRAGQSGSTKEILQGILEQIPAPTEEWTR